MFKTTLKYVLIILFMFYSRDGVRGKITSYALSPGGASPLLGRRDEAKNATGKWD